MHRQFPGRNQRSKGITAKNFVQYSLLLGVCFWLLYQLKHSHEKNIHSEITEASGIPESLHVDEIMKLGRKGVQENRYQETAVFKAKIEEGEIEFEESESGSDVDEVEEVENEIHSTNEDEILAEETDQEVENVPEARETNYKADDASSAVTHESQSSEENGNSLRDLEVEFTGSENGNSNITVAEGSNDHLMSSNSTLLEVDNDDTTSKNATVSTESLDETVEEEEVEDEMATTEVSDHSLVEDNSTSETNDEEDESGKTDEDPIDDTDMPNQTIDTIRGAENGEEADTE